MSLSVVVVNYINRRILRKSLDSVVNQSLQPAVVVVADDCSTDESCAIVAEYVRLYPFVRQWRNARNLGPVGNRDAGIRGRTSYYHVTFVSDDWFRGGELEENGQQLFAQAATRHNVGTPGKRAPFG